MLKSGSVGGIVFTNTSSSSGCADIVSIYEEIRKNNIYEQGFPSGF